MKLVRLTSLGLLTALGAACGDGREDVTPTTGNVAGVGVTQGSGGGGGAGGDGGSAGGTTTSGEGGTGATTTATTGGESGGGGSGGDGGAGGEGGGLPLACQNDVLDDGETDVDCGGTSCPGCDPGLACVENGDCQDLICTDLVCAEPTCDDAVINGGESDVDCGGLTCAPCDVGDTCVVPADCVEGVCGAGGLCAAPTCSDGVENDDETGVDCGGSCAATCAPGDDCLVDDDCESAICQDDFTCAVPACDDVVLNGSETSVDCGGPDCNPCGPGEACAGASDCTSNLCTQSTCACPAGMVAVPSAGFGSYCMDATEVTYAEYNEFWLDQPPFPDPACAWNENGYTPSALWPPNFNDTVADQAQPNYKRKPVRYVDWCDAAAYCSYNGKRLCGAIEGGPTALASQDDFLVDQWFNACTALGTNEYPYGDAFNTGGCVESVDLAAASPINVRDQAGALVDTVCQGGATGVFHMSGNVAEWTDSCNGTMSADDTCSVRGGSFASTDAAAVRCDSGQDLARDTTAADIGFRCCL